MHTLDIFQFILNFENFSLSTLSNSMFDQVKCYLDYYKRVSDAFSIRGIFMVFRNGST